MSYTVILTLSVIVKNISLNTLPRPVNKNFTLNICVLITEELQPMIFKSTVEPSFTDAYLIRSPRYYWQFALSLRKALTFSLFLAQSNTMWTAWFHIFWRIRTPDNHFLSFLKTLNTVLENSTHKNSLTFDKLSDMETALDDLPRDIFVAVTVIIA